MDRGLSVGAIAGIACGAVAILILVILVLVWYFLKKKNKCGVRKTLKHRQTVLMYEEGSSNNAQVVKGTSLASSSSSASLGSSLSTDDSTTAILSRAPSTTMYPQSHSSYQQPRNSMTFLDEPGTEIPAAPIERLLYAKTTSPRQIRSIPVQPAILEQTVDLPSIFNKTPLPASPYLNKLPPILK